MLKIAPTVDSVNELPSEEEELEFVKAFRDLMRLRNILSGFSDFQFEDLEIDEQTFEDYKSKYLDIHDKVKTITEREKVSILDDVDFELELIHRDEINVAYILRLLSKLHESEEKEKTKQREEIINLLGGEAQLRSKKELIEKFIDQNLPKIYDVDEIPEAFAVFWDAERQAALDNLCEEEQLILEEVKTVIENYLFTSRRPLRDSIVATLKEKPRILERKTILERVTDRIMAFVGLFDEGMGGV